MAASWAVDFVADSVKLRLTNETGTFTIAAPAAGSASNLELKASDETWSQIFAKAPPPGYQTLFGALMTGKVALAGEPLFLDRYLYLLELLLGTFRVGEASAASAREAQLEEIQGRYVNLAHEGRAYRVYFEEAGTGIPLLCLHTAGADGRQFREILKDPWITARFRVIAFDLPRHGKSSPPQGFAAEHYMLTTEFYVAFVMTMIEALRLERPVVMGCSIGGRAVLHLALAHGKELRCAIGLQSALYADAGDNAPFAGRRPTSLLRPDVNPQELAAAQVAALMAPNSPDQSRWETLWYYMQGGPGVFLGDLYYYFVDGDLRNGLAAGIDTEVCPIYMLTGEFDLSATPQMAADLANEIGATHFEVMRGLGHFPMSEDPERFKGYLRPVLEKILALP